MNSLSPVRPNVAGARWSLYIYTVVNGGMADVNACGSLCMMASNVTCHYYLYLNDGCYLGNVLISQSVIPLRNDSQNIYVVIGQFDRSI